MRIVFVVKVLPIKLPKHYQLQYNIKSTSLYAIHHNHSNHIPNVASTAEYIDVVQFNEYGIKVLGTFKAYYDKDGTLYCEVPN